MATRFLQNFNETSIQTGAQIQKEGEAKVGKTEMDEGCEDGTTGIHCLWVVLAHDIRAYADVVL
jgi:hypothetical protein